MERVYRSIDIARSCGIHVNTLRFYERSGLISPVPREKNNYRRFNVRHLLQVRVVRLVYQEQWPGRPIRNAALAIIEALKEWNVTEADSALIRYRTLIAKELENASAAATLLRDWNRVEGAGGEEYTVREVARMLSVTAESIRNWERNGLIPIPRRGPNRRRYITTRALNRLRIIAVLRKVGHSLAVIHRALYRLRDDGVEKGVEAFRDPGDLEIQSAGDHYIEVLRRTADNAAAIADILAEAHDIS